MKFLRVTMWLGKDAAPMTTLTPEADLRIGIYAAATAQRTMAQQDSMLGFTEVEIHEFPAGTSLEEAALVVTQTRRSPMPARERHMQTMRDWGLSLLEQLNPGGVAQTTERAPLSAEDVVQVLRQIAAAPNYHRQNFRMTARDGSAVELVEGEVVTRRPS